MEKMQDIVTKLTKHKNEIKDNYKTLTEQYKQLKKTSFAGDCAEKGYTYCVRNADPKNGCPLYDKKGGCVWSLLSSEFVKDNKKIKFINENPAAKVFLDTALQMKTEAEMDIKDTENGTN